MAKPSKDAHQEAAPGPAVRSDGYRCHGCRALHMELLTPPYRWRCARCNTVNMDGIDPSLAVALQ